jgi:hypothetical protein
MSRLRKVAAAVLGVLAILLSIELTFRFYVFGLGALNVAKMNSIHPLGQSGLIRASRYPEIIYELKPNVDELFKLARLRTNSEGLPDHEYPLAKPPGTFRMVLVGSSFSMAAGVALEESWQEQLEGRLNDRGQSMHYELINFSVGGYDPRQALATLEQRAIPYHPDLALVDLTVDSPSFLRPETRYHEPFSPRPRTRPFFDSFALDFLRQPRSKVPLEHSGAEFERVLARYQALSGRSGLRLCFVILEHDYLRREEANRLKDTVAKYHACVIDTTPAFAQMSIDSLVLYKTDRHPNAKAQQIFARVVQDYLSTHDLLDHQR